MAKAPSIRSFVEKTNFAPHQSAIGVDTFPQLKLDVIARDLQLEEHGRTRGAVGEPPVDTADFDEIEERIVDYVHGRRDEATATYKERFADYLNLLNALELQTAVAEIENASRRGVADIEKEVQTADAASDELLDQLTRAEADLTRFRAEHRLDREADYPTGLGAWLLRIGGLIAMLMVESSLNAVFLGEGNEYGLAGGALEAVVISGMNVFMSMLFGISAFRYAHHVVPFKRTVARLAAVFWFVFAVGFNLMAGHYRDALSSAVDRAGQIAWQSFLAHPIGLETPQSWMLWALGVTFAGIALYDGYKMSDPYPGYARVARKVRVARDDLHRERASLLENVAERYREALEEMEETASKIAKRAVHSEQYKLSIASLHDSYVHHLAYLNQCAISLLLIYRDANRAARAPAAAPKSFRRKPTPLPLPPLPSLPVEFSSDGLARLAKDAESRRKRGETRLEASRRTATMYRTGLSASPTQAAPDPDLVVA